MLRAVMLHNVTTHLPANPHGCYIVICYNVTRGIWKSTKMEKSVKVSKCNSYYANSFWWDIYIYS